MGMRLTHTTIWVLDQDEALDFYTRALGLEVNTDARLDGFRWLTVSSPTQRDHELILLEPGPPMMDEQTAAQVRALVAKGVLGPGAFDVDPSLEIMRVKRPHDRGSRPVHAGRRTTHRDHVAELDAHRPCRARSGATAWAPF